MKIYFSGGWGEDHRPAGIDRRRSFMLSFYDLKKKSKKSAVIFKAYLKRKKAT